MSKNSSIRSLEEAQEKKLGLPPGLLGSIRQQETGGKQAYLDDPSKYHYGLNAEGKRVAGHTGKISTAFGPYGLLESTGRDPGYGVKSLGSKDLEEQVRFAAQYVAGRIKSAGSVMKGLAGYGEGQKYANQVLGRLGGSGYAPPQDAPVQVAAVQRALPKQLPQAQVPPQAMAAIASAAPPTAMAQVVPEAMPSVMASMHQSMPPPMPSPEQVAQIQQAQAYQYLSGLEQYGRGSEGQQVAAAPVQKSELYRPENELMDLGIKIPQFNLPTIPSSNAPTMQAFQGWGGQINRYS